ncbi:hypothetical protein L7F22_041832 [Adiantum nelumboides]|nr:hypothetical protein [Adiantum nelumboides]
MTYLPFPSHWHVFSAKDKIGDWLEANTKIMELVYWSSTECKSAKYDASRGMWEVRLQTKKDEIVLYVKQLVLATDLTGFRTCPHLQEQIASKEFNAILTSTNVVKAGQVNIVLSLNQTILLMTSVQIYGRMGACATI